MEGGSKDECRRPDSTDVPKRKVTDMEEVLEDDDFEGEQSACVIEGSKHADGSIYRQDTHFCHRLYHLHDTRETLVKPTNMSGNTNNKSGCAMMQIFSLKLVNHSAITSSSGGPIQLYGFMAVRDLLQPLRNYVFNRTRDDPLVLHPCPDDPFAPLLIQMAGPKRGIYLQARALIEFDMRVKGNGATGTEEEDLQLIDGAATFSELTPFHGTYTQRIPGDHGAAAAVNITLALIRRAVEARIRIVIPKIPAAGLSLSMTCFLSGIREEIKLFDGVVDKPGNLGKSFVVAVVVGSPLVLHFKTARAGDTRKSLSQLHGLPARVHGCNRISVPVDSGTIEVQVSWANLD